MASRMDRIIEELEGEADRERFLSTKTGWSQGKYPKRSEISDCIQAVLGRENPDEGEGQLAEHLHFTIVRKANNVFEAWREEEALERLIVLSNRRGDTTIRNQVNLGDTAKESIDLVVEEKAGAKVLVELKPWKSGNNPLFAVVELLKNLELFQKKNRRGVEPRLAVLAPTEYYQKYSGRRAVDMLLELIRTDAPQIELRELVCSRKSFLEVVSEMAKKIGLDKWQKANHTTKYESSAPYVPAEEDIVGIKSHLLYQSWKPILKATDWPGYDARRR